MAKEMVKELSKELLNQNVKSQDMSFEEALFWEIDRVLTKVAPFIFLFGTIYIMAQIIRAFL